MTNQPSAPSVLLKAEVSGPEIPDARPQGGCRPGIGHAQQGGLTVEADPFADRAVTLLTVDLPQDLKQIYDLDVEVRIRGLRYGSLYVFFTVALAGYVAASRYKAFVESIELIRQHADFLLGATFPEAKGHSVKIESSRGVSPPPDRLRQRWRHYVESARHLFFELEHMNEPPWLYGTHGRRDGLFWLVLAIAILEFVVIASLVRAAVEAVYF